MREYDRYVVLSRPLARVHRKLDNSREPPQSRVDMTMCLHRKRAAALLLASLLPAGAFAQTAERTRLELAPCTLPRLGPEANARCGTLSVPENRANHRGRTIALRVVVLPATGSDRAPDPIFFIAGGPGASIVEQAGAIAFSSARLRERRDLVLVDQRGTGGSHPLTCEFYGPPDSLQSYVGEFMPIEAVRRCRAAHTRDHDLWFYTTSIAVQDLDHVRESLGAERINLSGSSYGTRAALEYMRRYPRRVRSAILYGPVPPSAHIPQHFALDAQRALDAVVAECAGDSACRRAFPRIAEEIRAVFARLSRARVPVTVEHPRTGHPVTVSLGYDMVAETVRYMLYQSASAALVPAVMHSAANGDFGYLARRSLRARGAMNGRGTFDGLYLAITCAEDVPFTDPARESAEAKGTFLGDYRMRQQQAACEVWGRSAVSPNYHTPVRSDAPVLLVTGANDPVTPPRNATEVARTLPNALSVIVPFGGHGLAGLVGLGCISRLEAEVIERGSVAGLDTSCVAGIRRAGFPTEVPRS